MHKHPHKNIDDYFAELAEKETRLARRLLATQGRIGARELWRFALTAAVIFIISFIGLNYTAYQKQISFWWNTNGQVLTSSVLGSAPTKNNNLLDATRIIPEEKQTSTLALPDLTLAVTPPENYIFIPRLGIRAPIREAEAVEYLGDWNYVENQIQESLKHGVVRFPGTALPGEIGNAFLTGHSSYYPWDNGRYKDIFALLPRAEVGDEIEIVYGQQSHRYRVTEMKEVRPSETDVLRQTDDARLTLMTCTPLGTALRRLIVTAELIDTPPPPDSIAMNR